MTEANSAVAHVTGSTGQDGSHLAEFLVKDFTVHGTKCASLLNTFDQIDLVAARARRIGTTQ